MPRELKLQRIPARISVLLIKLAPIAPLPAESESESVADEAPTTKAREELEDAKMDETKDDEDEEDEDEEMYEHISQYHGHRN